MRNALSTYRLTTASIRWLTDKTFEIAFRRPEGFAFVPGQKIRFVHGDITRDYSLVNGPDDSDLALCVRRIADGCFSPILARAQRGDELMAQGPFGFFTFQSAARPAVFVATGTGIAPFVSYVRSGIRGFICLHGVTDAGELYYRDEMEPAAQRYIPCISNGNAAGPSGYRGRVTSYLADRIDPGIYDFYLCGRVEMISDAVDIIDDRFAGSRVYSEVFF